MRPWHSQSGAAPTDHACCAPVRRTPLHLASSKGCLPCVEALLAAGADVDAADGHGGWTSLHKAADRGHKKVLRALLAAGAAPDTPTGRSPDEPAPDGGLRVPYSGQTALMKVRAWGVSGLRWQQGGCSGGLPSASVDHRSCCKDPSHAPPFTSVPGCRQRPPGLCAHTAGGGGCGGSPGSARLGLDGRPLCRSAGPHRGAAGAAAGWRRWGRPQVGPRSTHWCACRGCPFLPPFTHTSHTVRAPSLPLQPTHSHGARRPLMLAASGGHEACVRALLESGARVDARDHNGCTAAHFAAQHSQARCRCMQKAKCSSSS